MWSPLPTTKTSTRLKSRTRSSGGCRSRACSGRPVLLRIGPQRGNGAGSLRLLRRQGRDTTTDHDEDDTEEADKPHRGQAIIEQVHPDLKNSAMAHLSSAKFAANYAWLALGVIAFRHLQIGHGTGFADRTWRDRLDAEPADCPRRRGCAQVAKRARSLRMR